MEEFHGRTVRFWTEVRLLKFLIFCLLLTMVCITVTLYQLSQMRDAQREILCVAGAIGEAQVEACSDER